MSKVKPKVKLKRKWDSPSQRPEYKKAEYRNKKAKIFDHFGNSCNKCGFSDVRALQIDHVNGGGVEEFKTKGGIHYLNNVLKQLKTNKYQLLCANCNWIKRHENNENNIGKQVFIKV